MEQEQTRVRRHRGSLSHRAVEAITAFAIFVVGVVMMADNYRIGAGWAADGPESGYFPFRIGAILCVASIVVFLRALIGKQPRREVFVPWERFRLVMMVLLPTSGFVLAIQFIGIYAASAIFIAAFMRVMDKYGWVKTVLVSVGVSAAIFWMFEVWFLVPLPKGPIEALFGY
jgi:putative tricarboxylic transport membrane protein